MNGWAGSMWIRNSGDDMSSKLTPIQQTQNELLGIASLVMELPLLPDLINELEGKNTVEGREMLKLAQIAYSMHNHASVMAINMEIRSKALERKMKEMEL